MNQIELLSFNFHVVTSLVWPLLHGARESWARISNFNRRERLITNASLIVKTTNNNNEQQQRKHYWNEKRDLECAQGVIWKMKKKVEIEVKVKSNLKRVAWPCIRSLLRSNNAIFLFGISAIFLQVFRESATEKKRFSH